METTPLYIEAPARLHLGFLDLDGESGRRFGGLGLTISDIATKLIVSSSDVISVIGDSSGRVQRYAENFIERKGLVTGCCIDVVEQIIDHLGLGSGTQLALAVGAALTKLNNLDCTAEEVAAILNRGSRSGIGVGAFKQGGFLVDGGRDTDSIAPPIISRIKFPSNWRIILAIDPNCRGLCGQKENASFTELNQFGAENAAFLSHLVLMKVLPGLCEQKIRIFSEGIYEIQRCLGEYFASVQGGRYTSPLVDDVMKHLVSMGIKGVGQSSWGPTGFAFTDSETQAYSLLHELKKKFGNNNLEFKIVSGRNTGAIIKQEEFVSVSKANKS